MSNIDLASKEWCDLVFEGRNQGYGAYAMRAKASKRRLVSVIYVLIGIVALAVIIGIKTAVTAAIEANRDMSAEMETSFAELQKEEPKKEEPKKQEIKQEYEQPIQKVAVKASIAFTVPDIVDEVDDTKALKSQDEVTRQNIAIASQDYVGDTEDGINIDDLKDNQMAGGDEVPPAEEEILENIVEQKAQFPGGETALLKFIADNVKYPAIALEQELQGIVIVRFVVEKDGSVGEVSIRKSLSEECDAAAVKVVKQLPKFIPAKSQGNPVRVWYTVPVRFRIA